MMRLTGKCLIVGSTVATMIAFWLGGFPLGTPGEWTWNWARLPADFPLSLISLGIAAGVFGGWVWFGTQRLSVCSRWETPIWLIGLVLAGYWWLSTLQEAGPDEMRLSKAAWVLFYPGASGYFTEAREMTATMPDYLAGYEARMAKGDVLHQGTHPPGLILVYRGLFALCKASPTLRDRAVASQPATLREAFDIIAETTRGGPAPLNQTDRAVLWLAAAGTQFLCMLTVLPLYWLLRRDWSPRRSWLAVSLWPTVPALAVFLPKSDCLYPFFGMMILALWLTSWGQQRWLRCGLAGFLTCVGLLLSLALLPTLCLMALVTFWEGWLCHAEQRIERPVKKLTVCGGSFLVGLLLPIGLLWWNVGLNLAAVWCWNLHNHAGFYSAYPRTYGWWLLVNPLELAVAAGLPVTLLAMMAVWTSLPAWRSKAAGPIWASAFTWGLLWLSGKNMGEAARLWIVLMPWMIWSGARLLRETEEEPNQTVGWGWVWGSQMLLAVTIALRVLGFHVPGITG